MTTLFTYRVTFGSLMWSLESPVAGKVNGQLVTLTLDEPTVAYRSLPK